MAELLSIEDAAVEMRRSEATVYRWISQGRVRRLPDGRVRRSELVAVDKAMRSRRKSQHRTRDVDVVIDGCRVGSLRYNPATGQVFGALEPGLTAVTLEAVTRRGRSCDS